MKIYGENGYLDFPAIMAAVKVPFLFVIGGRGTGKTYGAEKWAIESGKKFIFLRRTQSQADLIGKQEFSPFKSVCSDLGLEHRVQRASKYHSAVTFGGEEAPRAYIAALSTFANIRGFDSSDIDLIVYDEFIPERHERPIKNEADAFFNVVETVGRNRELQGRAPVRVLCLANSNDIANPYFMALGLVNRVQAMVKKGNILYTDERRGLAVINCAHSPIGSAKAQTALYKLTAGGDFAEMALENQFTGRDFRGGKSRDLREYSPLIRAGEIMIYQHKGRRAFYVSAAMQGTAKREYSATEQDLMKLRRDDDAMIGHYISGIVEFETPLCELLFQRYFGLDK